MQNGFNSCSNNFWKSDLK